MELTASRPKVVTKISNLKHAELMTLIDSSKNNFVNPYSECSDILIGKRFSLNQKGYVQIAVKTPGDVYDLTKPNTKIQLHQVIAWNASNVLTRGIFRQGIKHGLEVSHLCKNKRCTNIKHLAIESSRYNKSRNSCPVIVFINYQEILCCKHLPRCIPTEGDKNNAIHYNVITSPDGENEVCELVTLS